MKIKEAAERYIRSKSAVLSPSTIAGYTRYERLYLQDLYEKEIKDLTTEEFQLSINKMRAKGYSPKTVKNAVGFVKASIALFAPEKEYYTTLPQKIKNFIYVPEQEEIEKIYRILKKDTANRYNLFKAFLLSSQCGLRPSEISALSTDSVRSCYIQITQARVRGLNGDVVKPPKSYAGYRQIPISKELQEILLLDTENKRICNLSAKDISNQWSRFLAHHDIPHFRFYALRHYFASKALVLGIPQKYIAEMMGHNSLDMIEKVYQHIFSTSMNKYQQIIAIQSSELLKM